MPKISIVTDTDCSLPFDFTDKLGIRQVPITVHFGEDVYHTGVDINDDILFERIDREGKLPTTAAPSPGAFAQAYKAAFEEDGADEIICLTVSGEVSATYDSALIAVNELVDGRPVTVMDTQQLSMGQGYMALAAHEAVSQGASVEEAIREAQDVAERFDLFASLATLKYLSMSGRVGHLTAGMASLLNIKPILTVRDGKLDMLEKVRTRKKAWARVLELIAEAVGDHQVEQMAIVQVAARDQAEEFETLLRAQIDCPEEIMVNDLSAGLSVHSGAGLVGVGFVVEK